jgi:aspartyl-tRNA(Asn)/glutamyl-tRNA(Gln) amidotransferase subunit A
MCEITIGSDTGGSCRTPAAFCGIVGFKPSRQRISTEGAFPLSSTLDSIGPMARSVADCEKADAVMAGDDYVEREPASLSGLRIGLPKGMPLERLDDVVARAFDVAIKALAAAGARIVEFAMPELDGMVEVNTRYGGIVPAEAFAVHHEHLEKHPDMIDPNVRARIERARTVSAGDYIEMLRRRAMLVREADVRIADFDAVAMPTAQIVPPLLSSVEKPEDWARTNAMSLRNTAIWNFFDCCAISLPLPSEAGPPAGLMLATRNGHDGRLFRIAAAAETVVS